MKIFLISTLVFIVTVSVVVFIRADHVQVDKECVAHPSKCELHVGY